MLEHLGLRRAYNAERQRLAKTSVRDCGKAERHPDEAQRDLDRTVQAVIKGRISDDGADRVLPGLRAEVAAAEADLAAMEAAPSVIALHPTSMSRYLATAERLREGLAAHAAAQDDHGTVVADFRALVHSVTVHTVEGSKDVKADVKGRLAALIGGEAYPEKVGDTRGSGRPLHPITPEKFAFRSRSRGRHGDGAVG